MRPCIAWLKYSEHLPPYALKGVAGQIDNSAHWLHHQSCCPLPYACHQSLGPVLLHPLDGLGDDPRDPTEHSTAEPLEALRQSLYKTKHTFYGTRARDDIELVLSRINRSSECLLKLIVLKRVFGTSLKCVKLISYQLHDGSLPNIMS